MLVLIIMVKVRIFVLFFFNYILFSKNVVNVSSIKFINTNVCNTAFTCSKTNSDKFILFEIKNVKKLANVNVFDIDLKNDYILYFTIKGEDKNEIEYDIDRTKDEDKNKKFELRLDLNNEKIEIQEITGYDNIKKKNIYSNNVFIFDFKDFTCVIFKLTKKVKKTVQEKVGDDLKDVEKEVDEDKYIFCNDCNTYEIGGKNGKKSYYGMFCDTLKEKNFYKVSVEWVSKNKDKWTNIKNMFGKNEFIEEVDFGNFDYNFNDISYCFDQCENLKNVKNLKKLFNDNLNRAKYFFADCKKIDNVDISDIKLPEDSSSFFSCSSIKNLKYDNLDCSKCKNLEGFFGGSDIEEFNFNKLKNTENIEDLTMFFCDCKKLKKVIFNDIKFPKLEKMDQMFDSCQILDEIIGFENIKLKLKNGDFLFHRCNNLKKLNLSNLVITDNNKTIVDFRYIKDLILPNDPNSAKLIINYIKEFFNRTYGNNLNNKFNIYYKNQKLENVSKFDDIDKFLDNPTDYINNDNRNNILKFNEQKYLSSLKNLDQDTLKTAGYCSKCCSNLCCSKNCCCGG